LRDLPPGHLDEGLPHLAHHLDLEVGPRQHPDQQQRGEHLAALGRFDLHRAAREAAGPDLEGEEPGLAQPFDVRALLLQRRQESADGPFSHLRHAIDPEGAAGGGRAKGGEKTRRGPGVAHKEIGLFRGDPAALAGHRDRGGPRVLADLESEAAQRLGHDLRVFAEQRPGQGHRAVAEGGEQERPVGEALRSGQGHLAPGRPREREDRQDVGQRHQCRPSR
jgi:hypothetical protein